MVEFLARQRPLIGGELERYLAAQQGVLKGLGGWGSDACTRLLEFSLRGKMIRGALVILGELLYGDRDEPSTAGVTAAAAMELLQSSFLIHDDIMDRDEQRRGRPTLFAQYTTLGTDRRVADPGHFGQAMGICAGDVAFFFAFDVLSRLDVPGPRHRRILEVTNKAVITTCVAQMQDVYLGGLPGTPEIRLDDVMAVYHHKTGRYTFSLPLQIGALISGASESVLERIEKLGILLGTIFQIKDDELGLFGSEAEIGKPVGSDIHEGKKTIYYVYLLQAASDSQRRELAGLFGRGGDEKAVHRVRRMVEELGVRRRIAERVDDLAAQARSQLETMPGRPEHLRVMADLLDYNLSRAR